MSMRAPDQLNSQMALDGSVPQSPAERRRVRQSYRELQDELTENRAEYVQDLSKLLPKLAKMDALIEEGVKSLSETTLDSRVLLQASTIVDEKLSTLKLGRAMFDVGQFLNHVFDHIGEEEPDLDQLGKLVGRYLRRAPVVEFMYGPLSVEVKKRETRQRQKKEDSQRTTITPLLVSEQENSNSANETTPSLVNALYKVLLAQGQPVPLYQFILNPQSFGQTVENLFYVSFLVRDGLAWVGIDDELDDTVIEAVEKSTTNEKENEDDEENSHEKAQWISAISYDEWKALCSYYSDTEPKYITHQPETDHDTPSQYQATQHAHASQSQCENAVLSQQESDTDERRKRKRKQMYQVAS